MRTGYALGGWATALPSPTVRTPTAARQAGHAKTMPATLPPRPQLLLALPG
ncbi:MAG: hypothetical protein WCY82_08360 [Desulfotomaculaceae bacterium]